MDKVESFRVAVRYAGANTRKGAKKMKGKIVAIMIASIIALSAYGLWDVGRIAKNTHEKRQNVSESILDDGKYIDVPMHENAVMEDPVKPKPDFDLENLAIVGKENEDADVSSRIESVGEFTEDSTGIEGTESDVEQDSRMHDESDPGNRAGDGASLSELVESESVSEAELEGQLGEHSGYTEDGYSDGYGNESEVGLACLGEWTVTAYCPCEICCGQWASGCTASGVLATSNHTVACGILPFGTQVMIDGVVYVVEDTGVSGEWIDIFFDTHEEALNYGMQVKAVYLVED